MVTASACSSTRTSSSPHSLDEDHNMWNPVLGLRCHFHVGKNIKDIFSEEELGRTAVLCRFEIHFYAISVTNKPICYRSHHCPCDLPLLRSVFYQAHLPWIMGVQAEARPRGLVFHQAQGCHTHKGLALWRDLPCPIYSGKHLHMQPAVTFVQSKMLDLLEAGTSVHEAASGSNHGGVELHPFPFFYDPRVG